MSVWQHSQRALKKPRKDSSGAFFRRFSKVVGVESGLTLAGDCVMKTIRKNRILVPA